jgi:thiol-disulfide isomerase/thioredoxin
MIRYLSGLFCLLFAVSVQAQTHSLKPGVWRALISFNHGPLPFNFESKGNAIYLMNASERLKVDSIVSKGDSVIITMPVFESEFRVRNYGDSLIGAWKRHAYGINTEFPFKAYSNNATRFYSTDYPQKDIISGKYKVTFMPDEGDPYDAIGLFTLGAKGKLTGTFLTNSGDYRYLEGVADKNNKIRLSAFDGMHAFVFEAQMTDDKTLKGDFYARNSHERWIGVKDEKYELPDPYSLTQAKDTGKAFTFLLPTPDSVLVGLEDSRFKNKPVIIQLMGSWCPNCMDESQFLAAWYKQNRQRGIEIVGIANEKQASFTRAAANVKRMRQKYGIDYTLVLGTASLEQLPRVNAYPTTIFLDRRHHIQRIYTGFNGPATGKYYEQYKEDFAAEIENLLKK